ncbi:MFS transporter [Francisella hispaniensis]|uniref:MFS transporter n=2 Tax=Francisella hispaniensis TaxID=622488 RepID=UPI0008FF30EF|nr:MFS transporter [Francisella hispaniensis]
MSTYLRIQIFIVALFFTMVSAFLQIAPSVNGDFIMERINISEDLFVKLSTLYFLSYALLQVPYGYLIDSKGFEKILPSCIFVVLIGSLIYWRCDNHIFIGIGRIIIGAGCASSYILVIFIATTYFKKSIIPLLISVGEISVGLGDYFAGNIYLYTFKYLGWHMSNLITITMISLLFFYSVFLVRKLYKIKVTLPAANIIKVSFKEIIHHIIRLVQKPTNIAIFIYSFLTWGIIMTFARYWGKNYYINMHSYSKEYALSIQEIYWISFLVAVLIVGACTNIIQQAKKYIIILTLIGVIAHLIFIIPILFSYPMIILITILCGISGSGITLGFFIIQYLNSQDKGLIISINNLFVVLGAMAGQIIFSFLISYDFNKIFKLSNNINSYFYSGIVMLLIWSILALLAAVFIIRGISVYQKNHYNNP